MQPKRAAARAAARVAAVAKGPLAGTRTDCPQALGNFIAGALAASIIGREAGRLNTSIEPNTARSQPHRVCGFQRSTYVSPRRRHAVRSRRCGIRDEAHPRHARRRAHTHHLRADHNPWGAAPCFLLLLFFHGGAPHARRQQAGYLVHRKADSRHARQGARPSSKGQECSA